MKRPLKSFHFFTKVDEPKPDLSGELAEGKIFLIVRPPRPINLVNEMSDLMSKANK